VRRALDLLVGGTAALASAPLVALACLLIRLESRGHPLYTQTRVGRDGRTFQIWKLRTMVTGAEFIGAGLAVQEGDERITRMGAFLRRTSLDELPNLWNVVRGDMSVIGPRPTVPVQVAQYTERQRGRLAVKPGITGWAQIHGWRGETDTVDKIMQRVQHDLYYIEKWSILLDAYILVMTPFALFSKSENAY
jgi:lipopolysaccharide/colanic/teichoic acid biosynthesis glycosyltransferase